MIETKWNNIKVSIIMPVYNQSKLITKSLDSIPDRVDIEVIVCDDCSTDGTYEILKNYNRIPLKLFRNEVNKGAGFSRNVCFDHCSGKYIFGLDSDDTLITGNWEYVVDNFLNKDYDYVRIKRIENDGSIQENGVAFHTYFLKRSTLGNLRCPEVNYAEDWDVFKRIHYNKNLKEIHSNVCAYRYNYPNVGSISWKGEHGIYD